MRHGVLKRLVCIAATVATSSALAVNLVHSADAASASAVVDLTKLNRPTLKLPKLNHDEPLYSNVAVGRDAELAEHVVP